MHTLISTGLSEIAAQRRAVASAVSRQVPEADSELATSYGLEQLCRAIAVHGAVDRPVDYWHHAAIDAAAEASSTVMDAPSDRAGTAAEKAPAADTTDSPSATSHDAGGSAVLSEPAPHRAEQPAETPAHADLPPSIEPPGGAITLPHTARRRLRQTGRRPVPGHADANRSVADPVTCRITRGAMHDYIRHRLLPGRRRELEDHLVDCSECTRAFTDVRESYWIQQAAPPVLRLGTVSLPDVASRAEAALR
ncbi:zf-HC2 domain-containing protein [Myceligenerans indicum]|uniref:Zf-HC2 domain-containing protein n=1 Tax=Myceligenerans indicum TaxID=2593663 RepID=A0ABS1LKS5_9MICO|nr:zf-HC2 domain-containing protein [Myceligenerans indicum]MBL0886708.1 zf-HC2 domain-containing protein [Myceligenerans indicum]